MTGPKKKEDMAERTCIVTREVKEPDHMIRFVAGPDAQIVPDLKRNLPGRGVWVTASRELVEQAVKKGAFARGLKASVKADKDLPDLVEIALTMSANKNFSEVRVYVQGRNHDSHGIDPTDVIDTARN